MQKYIEITDVEERKHAVQVFEHIIEITNHSDVVNGGQYAVRKANKYKCYLCHVLRQRAG
jgi:hypothetical protein